MSIKNEQLADRKTLMLLVNSRGIFFRNAMIMLSSLGLDTFMSNYLPFGGQRPLILLSAINDKCFSFIAKEHFCCLIFSLLGIDRFPIFHSEFFYTLKKGHTVKILLLLQNIGMVDFE